MRVPSREVCYIQFIGRIWMPAMVCAQEKTLSSYDLENLGEWTRDNVEQWLFTHSGDFREIIDFAADFSRNGKDWESPWNQEDSECVFLDSMYPAED